MKKKILVIGLAMTMVFSLAGCGKENSTETTSEAESTTAESVSSEETEVTTEEVVEENPTWFSENNITFTEGEVSAPVYTYARNEDGSVNESVEMTQMDGSYSEPVIEVSEPDENNNVTYTVTYDVIVPWVGMLSAEQAQSGCQTGFQIKNYLFMDAYTGTVFPASNLTEDNEHEYAIESEVEVDGKTYQVSASSKMEQEQGEPDWTWLDNNTKAKLKLNFTLHMTQTIVAPADYDGLIMFLDGNGKTEYEEMDAEVSEAHPFEDDIATTYFKDVTFGAVLEAKLQENYWSYYDDEETYISVDYNNIQVQFGSVVDEEETKTEGYVTINWKDGTSTQVKNIEYTVYPADEYRDYEIAVLTAWLDPYVEPAQVESVVVGGKVYSGGEVVNRNQ